MWVLSAEEMKEVGSISLERVAGGFQENHG